MIKETIEKVIRQENLSLQESSDIAMKLMSGELNNSQIAALLTALKIKGETAEEVAGFAKAMRENSVKINADSDNIVDVCGTGGDSSGTFNISTATAFVVAGAGVKVAKHGNRSISSKSGSADVLKELGVNIELPADKSEQALNEVGISFLFAPLYHPAMKHVMPVRRELAMKTIFNILGPLTNPASAKRQMIGTFSDSTAKLMADAARHLDFDKVCFVCTENKYDEILLTGETKIFEFNPAEGVKADSITAETFGYSNISLENIQGDSPVENAKIIRDIFSGKTVNEGFMVVAANSALALYTAGCKNDLKECKNIAEDVILSGKAMKKLNELVEFGAAN